MAMTENEAKEYIKKIKEAHPLASCICYGYVCGYGVQIQKYHDGHEPVGGKPILSAIKMKNLIGTVCVVARYYGGIKLGIGGLARAFSHAAIEAINNANPHTYMLGKSLKLSYDYQYNDRISYLLTHSIIDVISTEYLAKVNLNIQIKDINYDEFIHSLNAITNGNQEIKVIKTLYT